MVPDVGADHVDQPVGGGDGEAPPVALAWVMGQPGVTSPIIGPRTTEQLEDNLAAADVELTEDDRHAIDRLVPSGHHVAPYYEADFDPHRFQSLAVAKFRLPTHAPLRPLRVTPHPFLLRFKKLVGPKGSLPARPHGPNPSFPS